MKRFFTLLLLSLLSIGGYAQQVPELMYFKFNGVGSSVPNEASAPVSPAGTLSGATQGGVGQFGGALLGNGGATTSNSLDANWPLNLSGPWTISMWFSGVTNALANNYLFGGNAGSTFAFLIIDSLTFRLIFGNQQFIRNFNL